MAIRAFYRATTFLFPMYLSNNENDFSFLSFFLFLDWLGPLSWSVSSVCSPLVFNLCRRKNVRILSLVGGFLFPLSLLFTSFATELHQIFFRWVQKKYGVGYCIFLFQNCIILLFMLTPCLWIAHITISSSNSRPGEQVYYFPRLCC